MILQEGLDFEQAQLVSKIDYNLKLCKINWLDPFIQYFHSSQKFVVTASYLLVWMYHKNKHQYHNFVSWL